MMKPMILGQSKTVRKFLYMKCRLRSCQPKPCNQSASACEFDCLRSRFGLKEVSEGISWAVREIIVQIRCDRKDAQWVKNVDEVADRVYRVAHA